VGNLPERVSKRTLPGLQDRAAQKLATAPGKRLQQKKREMFYLGASESELLRCLSKKRNHLIMAGARAGNLPQDGLGSAEFISRLSDTALKHVCDWFYAQADFSELPDTALACKALDVLTPRKTEKELRPLWRAVLADFVNPLTQKRVIEFLSQSGRDKSGHSHAESDHGLTLVAESLAASKKSLSDSRQGTQIGNALAQAAPERGLVAPQNTHRAIRPFTLGEISFDGQAPEIVIGHRTNQLPSGQFFIHISGAIVNGNVLKLDAAEASSLFPDRGDATAFPNTVNLYSSSADSMSVWRVEHNNTDKKVQYSIQEHLRHAYEVFDLPHTLTEPDQIRGWIRDEYSHNPNVYPIFRLSDGTLIKVPSDTTDPGSSDFDVPLNGYSHCRVFQWGSHEFIFESLPHPAFKLDCASVRTLVKRLFKDKTLLDQLSNITNRQISELADLAEQRKADNTTSVSVRRVKEQLNTLFADRTVINELMGEILQLPSVKLALEEEQRRVANELNAQAQAAKTELGKLTDERRRVLAEVDSIKLTRKKEGDAMQREIKTAFEQATEQGLKTLASVSVFKVLLGLNANSSQNQSTLASPKSKALLTSNASHFLLESQCPNISSIKELSGHLAAWSIKAGLGQQVLASAVAALATVGLAAVEGTRRNEVVQGLTSVLAGGIASEVSVTVDKFSVGDLMRTPCVVSNGGSTTGMPFGEFLAARQSTGQTTVVRLKGINRSPPESFMPELSSIAGRSNAGAVSWINMDGSVETISFTVPVVFVLDLAYGRSVFPFAGPLAWEMPIIDTDAPWPGRTVPVREFSAPTATLLPAILSELASSSEKYCPAEGIPLNAIDTFERMYAAGRTLGLEPHESAIATLAAYGPGRIPSEDLEKAILDAGGNLAEKFAAYTIAMPFSKIFDMETP
jgi:hypothetical protein